MKASKGFTLIELVVVIVILGILAATALPKFIDLSSDAKSAALEGVAGAIESASAINYGGYSANSSKGQPTAGGALDCASAATAILSGGLPSGYTLTGSTTGGGVANPCTLTQTSSGSSKIVQIIGVP